MSVTSQSDVGEDSYPPVLTKADFVRRFLGNEFGNRGKNWNTLEEFLASGYQEPVHIRNRVAGGDTHYNVPASQVEQVYATLPQGDWYFAAMAPHHLNRIQGEVQILPERAIHNGYTHTYSGLHLYYSTTKHLPMRDALKQFGRTACGIMAACLLRSNLCPNSYEWLQILLSRYPGHCIEFSCFDCNWGTLPNFNTVFWEVRLF